MSALRDAAQHTLSRPVGPLAGVGLFSGKPGAVTFRPGVAGGGVVFRRGATEVRAAADRLTYDAGWAGLPPGMPVRNTTLAGADGSVFATVEHVMGVLAGLGVWEAVVDCEGPEIPIFDGSGERFAAALRPALAAAGAPVAPLVLGEPVEVRQGEAWITAEPVVPGGARTYAYELEYGPGAPIAAQRAEWAGGVDEFIAGIAPARTFSLEAEARAARAAGLFGHLSPKDMLVVGPDGAPIDNAWRVEREPACHKLLDLIGDLALLGRPLMARVTAFRSGHALTHRLCREVLGRAGG